jgi:hypothetical protein
MTRRTRAGVILVAALAIAMLAAAPRSPRAQQPQSSAPTIEGTYDVEELKRLIELAQESGFSEEQIREITVEDEEGHTIKAWEFIQAYEKRKEEEAARLAAERARVYLTPKDIMTELDKKERKDIDSLRDRMLFVE